jgi:extradiol dioxygenase family protein
VRHHVAAHRLGIADEHRASGRVRHDLHGHALSSHQLLQRGRSRESSTADEPQPVTSKA